MTLLNRYDLLEKLGAGGMGAVYTTTDRLTHQTIALKQVILSPNQLQFNASNTTTDPYLALALEFRTLAGLRHPHIISVLDYGFDDNGQPFFTMELLTNSKPITEVAKGQPLETQIRLINEMLLALSYLHRRGVIHRDLKPDNVLVTIEGQVKVLDFGIAFDMGDKPGYEPRLAGTMAYMAPELFMGEAVSVQSDLYSAGVIIYDILTGAYPFPRSISTLLNDILHTAPDTSALPAEVAVLLDSLLAKSPNERPASADAIIRELCVATGQPIPVETQTIRESFLQASKFVGRDTEFRHLNDTLESVLNGDTAFYLIGGESGVGKSRLVDELRTQALVKGATVLVGQGVAEGGLPFQMWRQIARRLALSTQLTDLEAGILQDIVPDISSLQGCEIPDAPKLEGQNYQTRLAQTLVDLLKCQIDTVVLVLEDLQWATESLEPLKQMLKIKDQLPGFLVVGTYRHEERPDLPDVLAGMGVINLPRLNSAAIRDLSESMLGEAGKQPHVVDLIQRETEGNAFFMVEVVRALAEDTGRLSDIGLKTLPESIFAGGVQQVVQRRLNRLPEAIRAWLKPIAIAGRQLDLALVHQFSQNGDLIENQLAQCADVAVLEIMDGNWRFNHDKIREGLILEITDDEKPALHRQVAEAIETVYPDNANYNEVLFEHWQKAGDFDKEIYYLDYVAERLIEMYQKYDQARVLLEDGLKRLPKDDVRRINLLNKHSRTCSTLNIQEVELAQVSAQEAFELAQHLQDQYGIADSLKNLGRVASNKEDFELAQSYYRQSLEISQAIGNQRLAIVILNDLGQMAWNRRMYQQAKDYYQESLEISQSIGYEFRIALSLEGLGKSETRFENFEQSRRYYEQSLEVYKRIGHKANIIRTLGLLGLMANDSKQYEQAQAYHEQAFAMSQTIGDRFLMAISLTNLAAAFVGTEDYERVQAYYEQALEISRGINDQYLIAFILDGLGAAAYYQGLYHEAINYLEEAAVIYRSAGGWQSNSNVIKMQAVLGILYVRTNNTKRAQRACYSALQLAHTHKLIETLLDPLFAFVQLYLWTGLAEDAAKLWGLLQHHPAFPNLLQDYPDDFVPDFTDHLSSEALQVALERGKSLELNTVIEHLLEEFAEAE